MADEYELELLCVNCGKPFTLEQWVEDGVVQMSVEHPGGCARPAASMLCDNPRKLSIVTGMTE